MKKIVFLWIIFCCSIMYSCKEETLKLYHGDTYIKFGPAQNLIYNEKYRYSDTLKRYTFFYDNLEQYTIYFDVYAVGGAANYDRVIDIQQIEVQGEQNAVANKHYVSFRDPKMVEKYRMPKDSVHILLPIVLLNSDPILKDSDLSLKVELVDGGDFIAGDKSLTWRKIVFSNRVSKPTLWNRLKMGDYSLYKHRWMSSVSGEKWDDEWCAYITLIQQWSELAIWQTFFKTELMKENLARAARLEEPMKDEYNNLIVFP